MGMSVGGSKHGPKSEINVTPLVDIVLVLLIVFLLITPIKMRYITLEVPRKLDQEIEDISLATRQIVVTLRADNTIKLTDGRDEKELANLFELGAPLRDMIDKKRTEKVVFVDFEDQVLYGDAVSLMDTVKGAGAEKVALKLKEEEK